LEYIHTMRKRSGPRAAAISLFALTGAVGCGRTEIWGGVTVEAQSTDASSFDAGSPGSSRDASSRDAPDDGPASSDAPNDSPSPGDDAAGDSSSFADSGDAGVDGSEDGSPDAPPALEAPRPISPLSTATVSSETPLLHWKLPANEDGAEVDICRDRACTTRVTTFQVSGSAGLTPVVLGQGVYFWRVRGLAGSTVGTANSPVWEFFIGAVSSQHEASWGTVPDVNGDGFADVLVGASGPSSAQYVLVYLGGAAGLATIPAVRQYTNNPCCAGYYYDGIASAGDVNGDGFADVVVGAPNPKTSGSILIYAGGPSGLSTTPAVVAPPGTAPGFGASFAAAGDVNGDGYADVIACAPYAPNMGCFLYYGSATGLSGAPTTYTTVTFPNGDTSVFGRPVAGGIDINGDGYGDVVLGEQFYPNEYVAVFLGSPAGLPATPSTFVEDPTFHGYSYIDTPFLGTVLGGAGDVNRDGYGDVLMSGMDEQANGVVYLYFGSLNGLSTTPAVIYPPVAGPSGGAALAGAGDVNGDGFGDVLIATDAQVYFLSGNPDGVSSLPTSLNVPGGPLGITVGTGGMSPAGDVNGDGFADVLVANPATGHGAAFLYFGSETGIVFPPVTLTVPPGLDAVLGNGVARVKRRSPRGPWVGETPPRPAGRWRM
jgi:hypothetical protein